jgi:hypothetical protein
MHSVVEPVANTLNKLVAFGVVGLATKNSQMISYVLCGTKGGPLLRAVVDNPQQHIGWATKPG